MSEPTNCLGISNAYSDAVTKLAELNTIELIEIQQWIINAIQITAKNLEEGNDE